MRRTTTTVAIARWPLLAALLAISGPLRLAAQAAEWSDLIDLMSSQEGEGDHRQIAPGVHLHEVLGAELYEEWCRDPDGVAPVGPEVWSAQPDTTQRNNFGPEIGGRATRCRGSCGGDCHSNNCVELEPYIECVDPWFYRVVRPLECHTHEGCRSHDDCLDRCALRYPGEGQVPEGADDWLDHFELADLELPQNFFTGDCSSCCHIEAFQTYGYQGAGELWKDGFESTRHPRDGVIVFEYTKNSPADVDAYHRCPENYRLECGEDGRGRCVPGDEAEVAVYVTPHRECVDEGDRLPMSAMVFGTDDQGVGWSVVDGPGRISSAGILTASGEGEIRVRATAATDANAWDEAVIDAGICTCYFRATLSGDVARSVVEGQFAMWSRPGQDAADVAGPLLRALGTSGIEDATGASPEDIDRTLAHMRQEGSQLVLKMVEGGEDVNSFNLTTAPSADAEGEIGVMALVDGLQFVGSGEQHFELVGNGWITGILGARTGPDDGVALRDGRGPPPRGYELEMQIEFRAGNPYRGAFCKAPAEE